MKIYKTTTFNFDFNAKVIKEGTYVYIHNDRFYTLDGNKGLLGGADYIGRADLVLEISEDNKLLQLIRTGVFAI